MKSQVLKIANELRYKHNLTPSESFKKAWVAVKLESKMKSETVSFVFKKKDGSIRQAKGTKSSLVVPKEFAPKGTGKVCLSNINYFDVDSNGWRSFSITNLLNY